MGATGGVMPNAGSGGGGTVPFEFDPACDCRAVGDYEFSCTIDRTTLAQRITPPLSCDNDLDWVHRTTSGPIVTYQWSEGSENSYLMQVWVGSLQSFKAFGYVGALCNIYDRSYQVGTIVAGSPPDAVSEDCTVCEGASGLDSNPDLPACEPCSDPMQSAVNHESLADFCSFHACPADVAAASADVATRCSTTPQPYVAPTSGMGADSSVATGCGLIRVAWDHPLATTQYYFDSETQALVGVKFGGDQPGGACVTTTIIGGTVPDNYSCADADKCTLCNYTSGAAGGGSTAPPKCQ